MEKIMAEQYGTKETKEALHAVLEIVTFIIERMKDGVGVDDAFALYSKMTSDSVFKEKLKAGYEGLDQVRNELSNLSNEEITSLGFDMAPDFIALLFLLKK
jgi:hypothetical protein